MAGHSKFKNIQHRKGAQDKKRAKVFNKLGREITVAAKLGTPDPDMNPRLRLAIQTARKENMPKDRIERAVRSGSPGGDDANYEEIRYEGYGPAGIAIIVSALTDNRNRTASEVRTAFTKHGGSLGETNSVSFMFDQVGSIVYPLTVANTETMFEAAAEFGAQNVETDDEYHEVITDPNDFGDVSAALEEKFGEAEQAGLVWKPQNTVAPDEDAAANLLKLIDALEDSDDVQHVYANYDIDDETMERLLG
jgi:YebC/PmpR family DNA-binding regulatory protein